MFETRVHCTSNGFQAAREAGAEEVAPGAPGGAGGSGGTRFAYSCFFLFISNKQQHLQLKKMILAMNSISGRSKVVDSN